MLTTWFQKFPIPNFHEDIYQSVLVMFFFWLVEKLDFEIDNSWIHVVGSSIQNYKHCFCSTLTWISLLFFVIRETVWVVTGVQLTKLQAIYLQHKLFWALFLPCSSLLIYHVSFHKFFHFIVLWLGKSAVNWIRSNYVVNLFCCEFILLFISGR